MNLVSESFCLESSRWTYELKRMDLSHTKVSMAVVPNGCAVTHEVAAGRF